MYSLILFGPILIFIITTILGRFLGSFYTALSVCVSTFVSVILALDAINFITNSAFNVVYYVNITNLLTVNLLEVNWHFYFDFLTLSMYVLITLVSFFIQIFSIGYMGEDASHVRFIIYLCFFMIAILLLVGSSNFIQIFFGWELVGLASFLLINFWFSRQDANISAYKAVAVNRVGDCFILFSIFLFIYEYETVEFDLLFSVYNLTTTTYVAFFFVTVGAFAKSAQFFFQGWLPDAMEGPTPVSALLHSATIVTAGVFLMLRFIDFLAVFSYVRYLVVFIGLLTALYAISIAAVADDTKRATAYTTLNQLGFMFFGCGSLAGATVLFHLIVHGFYKSFAFLNAAIELHDLEDEQDGEFDQLDTTNNFSFFDILTSLVFVSVNAIPFTSPSISKEFILLSGIEASSDYLTVLVTLILFSSPIDEGRDDVDVQISYATYNDDLYIPGSVPTSMLISVCFLGGLSIISASLLEEFFLDINFFWSNDNYFWIITQGSLLIFLPFFSIIVSEFDSSESRITSDLANSTVYDRSYQHYQSVLFNAELWYYDEFVTKVSGFYYKFVNFFSLQVFDRGYLEYLYVTITKNALSSFHSAKLNSNYVDRLYPLVVYATFTIIIFIFAPPNFIWVVGTIMMFEFFIYEKK